MVCEGKKSEYNVKRGVSPGRNKSTIRTKEDWERSLMMALRGEKQGGYGKLEVVSRYSGESS